MAPDPHELMRYERRACMPLMFTLVRMPADLVPAFHKKLSSNSRSVNPAGYLLKPSSPILSWE